MTEIVPMVKILKRDPKTGALNFIFTSKGKVSLLPPLTATSSVDKKSETTIKKYRTTVAWNPLRRLSARACLESAKLIDMARPEQLRYILPLSHPRTLTFINVVEEQYSQESDCSYSYEQSALSEKSCEFKTEDLAAAPEPEYKDVVGLPTKITIKLTNTLPVKKQRASRRKSYRSPKSQSMASTQGGRTGTNSLDATLDLV